jgi:hypothetical protein
MQCHDQGAEIPSAEVLKLVDDDDDLAVSCVRGFADSGEEVGQVDIEVAGVGRARFRVDVQSQFGLAVGDLDCRQKAFQDAQAAFHLGR